MDHQDIELSDVMVVLIDEPGMTASDAAAKLKDMGLTACNIDEDNGIVEGTIETAKVKSLETMLFVKYVRDVFNYVADFPPGDPRNLDPDDNCDDSETDDAGALIGA